uniref:Uncharacterized protein n=1 Tax=Alexandrium monilatum TaxID=311494 RepID=A0A7S4QYM4_9DINO
MGAERGPPAGAGVRLRCIDLYYMNVAPQKSSSSARRQELQESLNPATAARAGFGLVPRRVEAVTPDSGAWREAQAHFGSLPMAGSGKDDGAAANCILLSFREALRRALRDLERGEGANAGYIIVAEDDMMLCPSFGATLDTAMWELRKATTALGAALHSESLEQNRLDVQGTRLLFEEWPRYPSSSIVFPFRTTWPGELVIPDQPVALLLKASRLREFVGLYEQRLRDFWAPLDWLPASRNAFCRSGAGSPGQFGTGSDRVEQHRVAEGGEIQEPVHASLSCPDFTPARSQVSFMPVVDWFPPAQLPGLQPIPEGTKPGRKWMVVGGGKSQGLLVRSGAEFASFAYRHRLEAGAWIEELGRQGDRLHYKRLHGDGPDWGWVSLRSKGRQLLTVEDPVADAERQQFGG